MKFDAVTRIGASRPERIRVRSAAIAEPGSNRAGRMFGGVRDFMKQEQSLTAAQ
jgi:hypothetical protein